MCSLERLRTTRGDYGGQPAQRQLYSNGRSSLSWTKAIVVSHFETLIIILKIDPF